MKDVRKARKPSSRKPAPPKLARSRKVVSPASAAVEVANFAQWVRRARRLPLVRPGLVERVKAEIAAGMYETPAKLDIAIDRLIHDAMDQ